MELGNAVFGNSRGQYPIKRGIGWEEGLGRLLDALEVDNWRDLEPFENDVFWLMPYYWGECTCGWDFLDNGHERAWRLAHRPDCLHQGVKGIGRAGLSHAQGGMGGPPAAPATMMLDWMPSVRNTPANSDIPAIPRTAYWSGTTSITSRQDSASNGTNIR